MLFKIVIAVVICTIIGLVAFQFVDPNLNNGNDTTLKDDPNRISIGVTGEVVKAGNYVIDANSNIGNLIEAAGGVTSNADERCYFIETEVKKGESYYIAPKYDISDVCGNNPIVKTNINSANQTELMKIPGIGEILASSIIDYRKEHGLFYALEHITNVSGIGNAKFSEIKNKIILHSAE